MEFEVVVHGPASADFVTDVPVKVGDLVRNTMFATAWFSPFSRFLPPSCWMVAGWLLASTGKWNGKSGKGPCEKWKLGGKWDGHFHPDRISR